MQVKKPVRTRHGTMDWFKIGEGVHQGCILSPCLFNLYAEYTIRNIGMDEAQLESRSRRNINNLRYADDTTLMAESKEKLKSLLVKVKEPWTEGAWQATVHGVAKCWTQLSD